MEINNNNTNRLELYNNYEYNGKYNNEYSVGHNGLTGFSKWECYMIVKYGRNNNFNFNNDTNGRDQYLIELPLYPDQVTESITAQWATQKVLGRSSPVSAYSNTDLKTVNFSMDLHRDFLTGSFSHNADTARAVGYKGGSNVNDKSQIAGYQQQTAKGPFGTRTWYVNINKMLQIACYPQYTSKGLIPPTTYFIFGQMILKGYVTSYQTEWKKPILNTFYGWNSVSITMECYPDTIISASDIITNDKTGTASTQNTYNTEFPDASVANSNVMTRQLTNDRSNARVSSSLGGNPMQTTNN